MNVLCNSCGVVIAVPSVKFICCGCDNITTVEGDKISAVDMGLVEFIEPPKTKVKPVETRPRRRKVRKLDFEIR